MKDKSMRLIILIFTTALILRFVTAFFNYGYVAVDDYGIMQFSVPAQFASEVAEKYGDVLRNPIRSPLPELVISKLARMAWKMGMEDPLNQIRFIFAMLGLFSMASVYYGWKTLRLTAGERAATIGLLLISFHFLMPYLSTRTLIESMAAPFMMGSLYYLVRYHLEGNAKDLVISILWLSASSVFRFQAGIVILAAIAIIYIHRRKSHVIFFILGSLAGFILTGLLDLMLRGEFHKSLLEYMSYNLYQSSKYGSSPFYAYIPTVLLMMGFPFIVSRFRDFHWKQVFSPLLPAVLYSALFIVAHSAIPHKEERFLIPVLPVLFIIMAPLLVYFLEKGFKFRLIGYTALNTILLFALTFFPSQGNNIGLIRYFHFHEGLFQLKIFENSLDLDHLPISYAAASKRIRSFRYVLRTHRPESIGNDCDIVLVVREDLLQPAGPFLKGFREEAVFQSGPLEKLMVKISPEKNQKRIAIHLFRPDGCI